MSVLYLIVLIGGVFLSVFLFFPRSDHSLTVAAINRGQDEDFFSSANRLHWDHMPLTYRYDNCADTFDGKIVGDIENALDFISNRTDDKVLFEEGDGDVI